MKTDVWVVEYSAEQRCYHIDQLSKSLAANRRALKEGRNPGYIPIYIALSSEEAHALAELPADQRRAIINRYWLEVPADPRAHDAAPRALRHPSKLRALRGLL